MRRFARDLGGRPRFRLRPRLPRRDISRRIRLRALACGAGVVVLAELCPDGRSERQGPAAVARVPRRSGSADLKSRWDTAHDAWQHSLGDLRAEVEKLKERATAIESQLSDRLKQDFFRIFKQRQNVAVARVVNDSCSACRTRIRPALFQQLKRGELVHCEGCHRILYLEVPTS